MSGVGRDTYQFVSKLTTAVRNTQKVAATRCGTLLLSVSDMLSDAELSLAGSTDPAESREMMFRRKSSTEWRK
jgi:hypothetical protein